MVDLDDARVVTRKEECAAIHHPIDGNIRHRENLALFKCGDVRDEERVAPLPDQEIPVGGVRVSRRAEAVRRVRHHAACAVRQVVFAQSSVYRIVAELIFVVCPINREHIILRGRCNAARYREYLTFPPSREQCGFSHPAAADR